MIGALLSTDFAEWRRGAANDRLLRRGLPGPFPFDDRADASIVSDPAPVQEPRLPANAMCFQGLS